MGINTEFLNSKDLITNGVKDDKLIEICELINATHYLSGPAAKDYIVLEKFEKSNIGLEYIVYEYKEYKQLHGDFNHYVSIFDVLFNCGPESMSFILNEKKEIAFAPSV
ncbi:MAG: WbqC family protein [Flavobacteriaceae bacterium]|nr:WbqC family protein [Flavobacteriaceae bacterium]